MLIAVMVISYLSTVGAGLFSYGCATKLFPHYLQVGEISTSAVDGKTFEPYINLKIPPVCDILTALLLSFMVGVGIIFTGANGLKKGFDEFGEIVKLTIEKVIIPLLPFYILTMMCEMSASGKLAAVMGSGVKGDRNRSCPVDLLSGPPVHHRRRGRRKEPFQMPLEHHPGLSDGILNLLQLGCDSGDP